MIEAKEINRLTNRHIGKSFAVICFAVLLIVLSVTLLHFQDHTAIVSAAAIAGTFGVVEALVVMKIWKRIVVKSPESLPTFYTALSGFRMLMALAVLLVVYIIVGRDAMLPYFMVFVLFYFILLILHSLFFKKMTEKLL